MDQVKRRGASSASKAAGKYLEKHPDATAKEMAKKFKIDLSTVYRSEWWTNRTAAKPAD